MKTIKAALLCVVPAFLAVTSANAWHLSGQVTCPNGTGFPNVTINISGTNCDGTFNESTSTDSAGQYVIALTDCDGAYTATLDVSTLPANASLVGSATVSFTTTADNNSFVADFEIGGAVCGGVCWFTGGGAKIDPLIGLPAGHKGKWISFGGNVNPGCSPTAGDGGNWNHVDRLLNLHFQGQTIRVLDCGNVTPPPPPGSTSPRTPFNFIEWTGSGRVKGIQGNKLGTIPVYFNARTEDRNEPGTKGANAGAGIDRYYLHVFTNPADPAGSTVLLVNGNADPTIVTPVEIDDGNFQIHVSSCDDPPLF